MRAVVQRVVRAVVTVEGADRARIGPGLLILLGVGRADDAAAAARLAGKVARLRIFEDAEGRFDRSLLGTGGAALVVSQFTLLADTSKGNRPSFSDAAPPAEAEPLYEAFCAALRSEGAQVETGVFGARMQVELVNNGPATLSVCVAAEAGEAAATAATRATDASARASCARHLNLDTSASFGRSAEQRPWRVRLKGSLSAA